MSEPYDYGPLVTYEVTWKSGHIEIVQGHQVTFDSGALNLSGLFGPVLTETRTLEPRFTIHGQFDGRWRLVLAAPEAELHSIRDITDREAIPGGEATS